MQVISAKHLLSALEQDVQKTIQQAAHFDALPDHLLHYRPQPAAWSIAQVLAHLNSYNRYYLTHIARAMQQSTYPAATAFRSGFFGNYFTNMMQAPPAGATNFKKYKAPKDHTPPQQQNSCEVLTEFREGQERLVTLLRLAASHHLSKVKVPVSISKMIKLRLGDTFRFLIAHQLRHFAQIARLEQQMQGLNTTSQSPYPHPLPHTADS